MATATDSVHLMDLNENAEQLLAVGGELKGAPAYPSGLKKAQISHAYAKVVALAGVQATCRNLPFIVSACD